ncbi:MAG: ankyrin repeat domain-containing protein [Bryobacteraceae bacterium]
MPTLRFTLATIAIAASVCVAAPARVGSSRTLIETIRSGDLDATRAMLDTGADPNTKDAEGTPAVMNAALYGTAAHVKLLLDRGAKPDTPNATDSTALIWAAGDPDKAKVLIAAGADVNAQSKFGRTALMAAAGVAGNASTVKLLLEKGAKVDVRDNIDAIPVLPTGGGKGTALIDASRSGDVESVRALISAGADVNAATPTGVTALSEAVMFQRAEIVRVLLDKGASPANPASVLRFPILSLAAMRPSTEIASMLLKSDADVNSADVNGNKPLMWAGANEQGNSKMVELLIKAGADVKARNKAGETALDWALRRGETAVVRHLRAAGATRGSITAQPVGQMEAANAATSRDAMELAMGALNRSMQVSLKKGGCATCHNHTLPLKAAMMASSHGVEADSEIMRKVVTATKGFLYPASAVVLEGSDAMPDVAVSGSHFLEGLHAQNYPADRMTAAVVHKIAQSQLADGHWAGWAPRPPLEHGDIQATALAIRAMTLYPIPGRVTEIRRRVARARVWLSATVPVTTDEHVMRLRGLIWSAAAEKDIREAARRLTMLQRNDGGWAQLPNLGSDAWATANAMIALMESGATWANIKGGEHFLRETQFADGSWRVRTRAYPFQPLVDAGFPHGRDQWISAAATSASVMALAMASR